MRKRVGLARAIAMDPEIILYDEPTTGLDPIMADVINDLIIKLREGDPRDVGGDHARHGERVQDRRPDRHALPGEIQAVGTPDEIRGCDNPIVQQFIHGRAVGPIGWTCEGDEFGVRVRSLESWVLPAPGSGTLNWIQGGSMRQMTTELKVGIFIIWRCWSWPT